MNDDRRGLFATPESIPVVFIVALILYFVFQYTLAPTFLETFNPRGNDDTLRLLSVRDLLGGQAWYDKVQHRILPPEGLDLHWSRLIDGVLALLVLAARPFTTPEVAERFAAAVWPAMLFIAFLILTALAAHRARGPAAAAFAMIAAALLPVLNINYFAFGRVDHHSFQVVCMIGLLGTLMNESQHRRAGFAGGGFAAVSLSVGLEMTPFIALCLLVLVQRFLRHVYGSREQMLAFGLAFGALSALLFPIEVAPWNWAALQCDRFALPALVLAMGTMVFVFVVAHLVRETRGVMLRSVLTLLVAAAILAVLSPALTGCLTGPYAEVPQDVQRNIIATILENTAALDLISNDPRSAISHYLPILMLLPFLLLGEREPGKDLVALFLVLGLIGAAFQLRATIWALVVLPLGFGLVMDQIVNTRWKRGLALLKPFVVLGFLAVFLYPPLTHMWVPWLPASSRSPQDSACRNADDIRAISAVPRGLAMTPLNLSVPVLFYTDHAVTSAPYHTRPEALLNGSRFHEGNAEELRAGLQDLGADFVVVCEGSRYGPEDSAGSRLARGETLPGLSEFELEGSRLRVMFLTPELPELDSDLRDLPFPELPQPAPESAAPEGGDEAAPPVSPEAPEAPVTPDELGTEPPTGSPDPDPPVTPEE